MGPEEIKTATRTLRSKYGALENELTEMIPGLPVHAPHDEGEVLLLGPDSRRFVVEWDGQHLRVGGVHCRTAGLDALLLAADFLPELAGHVKGLLDVLPGAIEEGADQVDGVRLLLMEGGDAR